MANKQGMGVIALVPHDDFCDGDKNCTCGRAKTVLAIRKRITKVLTSHYAFNGESIQEVTQVINEIMRGDPKPSFGVLCEKCKHTKGGHNG
jgi:hypothetical protein